MSMCYTGIIVVNNKKATPNQIIQNGDLISNVSHRYAVSECLCPDQGENSRRTERVSEI